jgi:hypothetical protein
VCPCNKACGTFRLPSATSLQAGQTIPTSKRSAMTALLSLPSLPSSGKTCKCFWQNAPWGSCRLQRIGSCPKALNDHYRPAGAVLTLDGFAVGVDDLTIQPLPPIDKAIGIDAGITSLVTTSDGEKRPAVAASPLFHCRQRAGRLGRHRLHLWLFRSSSSDPRFSIAHRLQTD